MNSQALRAAVLVCLSGCTLLSAPDTEQCDVDADCVAKGAAFAGTVCESHVCVASESACTSMADCEGAEGVPYACVEGDCVQLTSQDCPEVVPANAVSDDTIYLGWMGPLKGDYAGLGIPIKQGAQLALEEIDRANGVPIGAGRKKLALIACHDLDDTNRAAAHLIENVRVPAIVGPTFSGITISVANTYAVPNGTLLISPSATSPAITDLNDEGLVWRTAPSDALQAIPLAALVSREEARIRTELALEPSDPIRVAVAYKGEAYGEGLFGAITMEMRFNGKSASDNGSNFLPVQFADPSTGNVDYSENVSNLVSFAPHIVVLLGTSEIVPGLIVPMESAWPTVASAPPRPVYLLPDGGHDVLLLDAIDADSALRTRVRGTVPGRKGANYDAFALRYKARFNNATPGTYAENSYDAGYALAYAMLAAQSDSVSGVNIAKGLLRMSDGTRVVSGPSDFNRATTALTGGGGIDFEGASGALDFDANGEASADVEIWCVVFDQNKARFESSGEYYDSKSGDLAGENTACAL